MKWSVVIGRFWGTEIRLHVSLLLLIPYVLFTFDIQGLRSSAFLFLLLAAVFACVAFHEMGHTLAARLAGIEVKSIVLWPLGGFANLSRRPDSVIQDIIISAAGPLTNLLIAALLAIATLAAAILQRLDLLPKPAGLILGQNVFPFLAGLSVANLSLAVFNLIPIYPLDGGQISRNLLKLAFGERWADLILLVISLPLTLILVVLGLAVRDIILILSGLLMLFAALTLHSNASHTIGLAVLYVLDRGGYYLRRSDFDPAVREYTRAIQRSPNRAGLYASRAITYINLFELEQARRDIDRALALDSDLAIAWTLSGELHELQGQCGAALLAFNRAVELKPGWAVTYLDRGGLYQEMNQMDLARKDIDKAVELGRGSPVYALLRGRLRFALGDREGAQVDYEPALRYAPQWMLVFSEASLEYFKDHLNWAIDYYNEAVRRMPGAYQAYQGRADACRVNGKLDWALADYHRAIERAPKQAELYLNRGRTYLLLGDQAAAAEDFRAAARLPGKEHIHRQAQALLNQIQTASGASKELAPAES